LLASRLRRADGPVVSAELAQAAVASARARAPKSLALRMARAKTFVISVPPFIASLPATPLV